jgi:hypothetical protein
MVNTAILVMMREKIIQIHKQTRAERSINKPNEAIAKHIYHQTITKK